MNALRLACVILTSASTLGAQSKFAGVSFGSSDSHFHSSSDLDYETQPGGAVGIVLGRRVSPFARLQLELNYAARGSLGPGVSSVRARYLEAPVMIRLQPWEKPLTPFAAVGLSMGRELSCSHLAYSPVDPTPGAPLRRVELGCDEVRERKWDVARVLAGGLGLRQGRYEFTGEVRVSTSVRDLNPSVSVGRLRYEAYQIRLSALRWM